MSLVAGSSNALHKKLHPYRSREENNKENKSQYVESKVEIVQEMRFSHFFSSNYSYSKILSNHLVMVNILVIDGP